MALPAIAYKAPPTVARFIKSDYRQTSENGPGPRVCFIKGPVGSGKSVGCCVKILRIAMTQAPGIDGIRKTRFTVVRNTRDQLKDTTLKTWLAWFPNGTIGNWKEMDRTYYIKFVPPDGIPVESEVMFRALDDPDDVAKVLSLEVTAFFFNECREIVREIAENAISRAGRYPDNKSKPPEISSENWPTWYGVFGDTNAPEMDSYWANVFEHLPVDDNDPESVLDCETFSQPPGDSEEAENIDNLPGKRAYYARGGRSMEWYRTMVQVKYGRSLKGRPVYEDAFKEEHLSATTLKIDPYAPVVIGLDTARTPAAVFMQRDPITGRILKQREAVAFGMGAKMFIKLKLRPILRQYYPNNVCIIIGDPSFKRRNETDDNSWYKVLKDEFPSEDGHLVKEASTNDSTERINALDTALSDFPRGVPLVQYDPSLKWCREGLRGKYRYLRVKGSGEKFQASPDKNNWSHVIEADQYGTMFINSKHYRPEDYVRPAFNPFARQQSSSTAVNYHAR